MCNYVCMHQYICMCACASIESKVQVTLLTQNFPIFTISLLLRRVVVALCCDCYLLQQLLLFFCLLTLFFDSLGFDLETRRLCADAFIVRCASLKCCQCLCSINGGVTTPTAIVSIVGVVVAKYCRLLLVLLFS